MRLPGAMLAAVVTAATSVQFPVSTSSESAQAAVDRGLFLYYAYDGFAAYDAFQVAARYDPRLAMAYWGMALSSGPDLNTPMTAAQFARGAASISKAEALLAGATPRERQFVAIMGERYKGSFARWSADDAAYREAMLRFARASGDEAAELLAAEASLEAGGLSWKGGQPARPPSRDALALVSDVLQRDPSNPMANHLCIHLYDVAPDRTPALACAQHLDAASFASEAEHLAHMPAHYWIETGDYARAEASSQRAIALLNDLPAPESGAEYEAHYRKHDIAVGYSAAMMLGNYAAARHWADRMAGAFDTSFYALTALRFGRYSEAYGEADSGFEAPSVKGLAALQLGRLSEAALIAGKISTAKSGAPGSYLADLFLARLAEAKGDVSAARGWIARAETTQRAEFSAEVIPLIPAGEALGALELRLGDAPRAIDAFTQTLQLYPNDPRALFGLAEAYLTIKSPREAAAVRARFEGEWKGADTNAQDALP
ncbi:MAG: hypothetical protein JO351_01085 [Candidatus Eremiobacteraeota bacterium]|nr:hypothetical protein [Candidatus Eremiobacteraeota bacterium]